MNETTIFIDSSYTMLSLSAISVAISLFVLLSIRDSSKKHVDFSSFKNTPVAVFKANSSPLNRPIVTLSFNLYILCMTPINVFYDSLILIRMI